MNTIAMDHLESEVDGLNLQPGTLADQMHGPTLLVFLRHFGCMFCREMVRDLRAVSQGRTDYPGVLFFCQGDRDEARAFFGVHWPGARVVLDGGKKFYAAMGLRRATFGQLMGLGAWTCGFRALSKGNFIGKPVGDPWIMPGVFLVQGNEIVWSHPFRHQGDHPDWQAIPGQARAASVLV